MSSTETPEASTETPEGSAATDTRGGLLIEAELTLTHPNAVIRLHTEGETLYVDAESFAALGELRATATSEAVDWLRRQGIGSPLSVETPIVVRIRELPVARYEPAASAGWLADRLGIAPFSVDLSGVLRAVGRRLRV